MTIIEGTSTSDYLYGDATDDRLYGKDGEDSLFGSDGNDRLYGANGNDSLFGQNGNDFLSGGNGSDRLFGYTGNDTLAGGSGDDLINGAGFAYDDFTGPQSFGDGEVDVLTGGTGKDTFQLWGGSGRSGTNVYYDSSAGSDYALITDFNVNDDAISLTSNANDIGNVSYSLGATPSGVPSGTGIYIDKGGTSELIAVLQNVDPSSLSLNGAYFTYS
jgi:Ca2+-binding RTX toxin-like protein